MMQLKFNNHYPESLLYVNIPSHNLAAWPAIFVFARPTPDTSHPCDGNDNDHGNSRVVPGGDIMINISLPHSSNRFVKAGVSQRQ